MADLSTDVHKDVRLIERALAKGFMSRASADKLMKDLPDLADKADYVDIDGEQAAAAPGDDPADDES